MIYGYKPKGLINLPPWSQTLVNLYWHIRVERRNKSKRVKYYRYVKKEKLRLAESGIHPEQIRLMCRYLASFNRTTELRLEAQLQFTEKQMSFDF